MYVCHHNKSKLVNINILKGEFTKFDKGKHTEDLRIERKIHKSTKLVPTHTLTHQLMMKICRRVPNK